MTEMPEPTGVRPTRHPLASADDSASDRTSSTPLPLNNPLADHPPGETAQGIRGPGRTDNPKFAADPPEESPEKPLSPGNPTVTPPRPSLNYRFVLLLEPLRRHSDHDTAPNCASTGFALCRNETGTLSPSSLEPRRSALNTPCVLFRFSRINDFSNRVSIRSADGSRNEEGEIPFSPVEESAVSLQFQGHETTCPTAAQQSVRGRFLPQRDVAAF